jgi:hypothetical protein
MWQRILSAYSLPLHSVNARATPLGVAAAGLGAALMADMAEFYAASRTGR